MANYRICTLDSGGTTIADYEEFCGNDNEARVVAKTAIKAGGVAEIWAGLRKVDIVYVRLSEAAV